jgi:hypothetical protein
MGVNRKDGRCAKAEGRASRTFRLVPLSKTSVRDEMRIEHAARVVLGCEQAAPAPRTQGFQRSPKGGARRLKRRERGASTNFKLLGSAAGPPNKDLQPA